MNRLIAAAFTLCLCVALLLVTLQYFLSPLYLELEYDFAGFPPPRGIDRDQRYIGAQMLLSYLNVEVGGASLLTLEELSFDGQRLFTESDLACIFRAKELRGYAFGLTFVAGVAAIALGLVLAATDYTRAQRHTIASAGIAILLYTALSIAAQHAFATLAPTLLGLLSDGACAPAEATGLARLFPPTIFRDALVLLALFGRYLALAVIVLAILFDAIARRLTPSAPANHNTAGSAIPQ